MSEKDRPVPPSHAERLHRMSSSLEELIGSLKKALQFSAAGRRAADEKLAGMELSARAEGDLLARPENEPLH